AVVELDHRHLSPAVQYEELRRPALTLDDVDDNPGVWQRQAVAHPFHLQAIARFDVAIDLHSPLPCLLEKAGEQAESMMSILSLRERPSACASGVVQVLRTCSR